MTGSRCPSCGSDNTRVFHEQRSIPVNSCLLLDDQDHARRFPVGNLELAFCSSCGFVYNQAYETDRSEYSSRYEETQGFSPRFRAFARELAQRWIDRYDLAGKHAVEIGCGKGEFLVQLCELGVGRGTGIDPSYRPDRLTSPAADRIEFIRDFYSERYAHLTGDAIVCRHTLEHIPDVRTFVETVRRSVEGQDGVVILFELPDVLRVLREIAFWDIYYEHCSYFTTGSLARLFRSTGFDVLDLALDFDDQYILLEARPGDGSGTPLLPLEDDLAEVSGAVDEFERTYPGRVAGWRDELSSLAGSGKRTVIWGAGSKGVSYLTTLGIADEVEFAVDINPFKHGMYLAGTGQRIVSPEFLREYEPDVVIAMNAIYTDEIRGNLDELGVGAELIAV